MSRRTKVPKPVKCRIVVYDYEGYGFEEMDSNQFFDIGKLDDGRPVIIADARYYKVVRKPAKRRKGKR